MGIRNKSDDYILQLSKITVPTARLHLMTYDEMGSRMEQLYSSLKNTTWIRDKIERQERRIKLKISYMMMCKAFKSLYGVDLDNGYDELVEKQPLVDRAHELEEKASQQAQIVMEDNPRNINEYDTLRIAKRSPISDIKKEYEKILDEFEDEIDEIMDSGHYTNKNLVQYETILFLIERAYKNLCDPMYKMKLDDEMMLNFKPNQSAQYIPGGFAQISYIPERDRVINENGQSQLPAFCARGSNGDETIIIQTGDVGFGRYRQKSGRVTYTNDSELKEYKVIKKYSDPEVLEARKEWAKQPNSVSSWDDIENGEVFYVYGNIDISLLSNPTTDSEYRRYNNDVLLSTANLEIASTYNGGYIGEIGIDRNNREYIVEHNKDRLCLAKDFERLRKTRVRQNRPIMGVPYKVNVDGYENREER